MKKSIFFLALMLLTALGAQAETIDLSTVTADVIAKDGDVITGSTDTYRVTIETAATVTLDNVTINAAGTLNNSKYAGISCREDVTLILKGKNYVKSYHNSPAGVWVLKDKTLTIKEDASGGELEAYGNGNGPGIGGHLNGAGGNLVIKSGTIKAEGANNAAGIGAGPRMAADASFGTITIEGGVITAIGAGRGAGIGSGMGASCGAITIKGTSGVRMSISATKGEDATNSLGAGNDGSCGTIKVEGTTISAQTADTWKFGDEIYAATSNAGKTLTLYYDTKKSTRTLLAGWTSATGTNSVSADDRNLITKVQCNASMINARPTTMRAWFYSLKNATTFDFSNLNTSEVTDMAALFRECNSVETLDLTNFKTANVVQMMYMFDSCKKLKELDLSSFNTEKVTQMNYVFEGCSELLWLDISSFNFDKVNTAIEMFSDCYKLTTIYCKADLTSTTADVTGLFSGSKALVGENGTTYDDEKQKEYARLDEEGKPGYFSLKRELYGAFTDASKKTLVLYYDDQKDTRAHVSNWPEFSGSSDFREITTAVFDESIKIARPTTTEDWFFDCETLASIEHLEYLNTSKVTTMYNMFRSCKALTAINVNSFDISSLTNTTYMFLDCENLVYIICDKTWNTGAITESDSWGMFNGCEKLKGGNGTTYDSNKDKIGYAHPDVAGDPGYFITEAQYKAATGVEEVQRDKVQSTKMMENGVLYIKYNGRMYDVRGTEVK